MTSEHDEELQELRKFMKDQEQKHKKCWSCLSKQRSFFKNTRNIAQWRITRERGEGVNLLVDMESEDK
jgi:hypothetical protein